MVASDGVGGGLAAGSCQAPTGSFVIHRVLCVASFGGPSPPTLRLLEYDANPLPPDLGIAYVAPSETYVVVWMMGGQFGPSQVHAVEFNKDGLVVSEPIRLNTPEAGWRQGALPCHANEFRPSLPQTGRHSESSLAQRHAVGPSRHRFHNATLRRRREQAQRSDLRNAKPIGSATQGTVIGIQGGAEFLRQRQALHVRR